MTFGKFRAACAGLCGAALIVAASPAMAGGVVREGFTFPNQGDVKIVVFRPDVQVGSMRVGGMDEANPDWTKQARDNIQTAMEANGEAHSAQMHFLGDYDGADGELVNQYRGLFEAVASSVFQHHTLGDHLPTKLAPRPDPNSPKRYQLDWTLGDQAARLKSVTGGDYALFFFTHDAYGDAGRKVAQLIFAGVFGGYIPAGIHIGYASLVDLKTGNIVWFNTDLAMGGDPRNAEGAAKRVSQLLAGFPLRDAGTQAAAVKP